MPLQYFVSAYRSLRVARSYALFTVLSLAVGIGGNLAIFTLVNTVILKPLSFPKAGQLVLVTLYSDKFGTTADEPYGLMPIQFLRWRRTAQSFQSFATAQIGTANLLGDGQPEKLGVMNVSAEFFDTLRVHPCLGNWFSHADEVRGSNAVVILSYSLWHRRFSADRNIVGKEIKLADGPAVVIGVAPADLHLFRDLELGHWIEMPTRTDLFRPLRFTAAEEKGAAILDYAGIARLKDGVTAERARTELNASLPGFQYADQYRNQIPSDLQVFVRPLREVMVGNLRSLFLLLLEAAAMVFLIASANLANLGLVRATHRARELAIRAALGARRFDLTMAAIAESVLLSAAGTILGIFLHQWITEILLSVAPNRVPRLDEVADDTSFLAFAAVLFVITVILLGIIPVWKLAGVAPHTILGSASRGNTSGRGDGRMRSLLVGFETALGTILLILSGLLLTSFHRLINAPRGFGSDNVLAVKIALPESKYSTLEGQSLFCKQVLPRLLQIPGVDNAAVASIPPLSVERNTAPWVKEGAGEIIQGLVNWPRVSPTYFDLMHIALRSGRKFSETGEKERVAILSESAARALWPSQNPISKRVAHGLTPNRFFRVIGIVDDVRASGLSKLATPAVYRLFEQRGGTEFSLMIRSARPAKSLGTAIRKAIWSVDSEVPVSEVKTMTETANESVSEKRFQTILISTFALAAMLLAVFGIYAVVSQSIAERYREIGLRIALGADSTNIRHFVFRYGMLSVSVGLVVGIAASAGLAKLLSGMLFEVSPLDVRTFIGAPFLLAAAAALPCFLIARSALRVDPLDALHID